LEAVSPGDPQVSEISLGDLHFSGEAIVGGASLNVQSGLSTGIYRNHWLQTRFEPDRRVGVGGVWSLLRKCRSVGLDVRSLLRNRQ
jgi:hypothetical protein